MQMNTTEGTTGVQALRSLLSSRHPCNPNDPGPVQGKGVAGVGEGTDQHEEEDEGHDIGHVRHRLQDDADDPGQRLHRHAHMHQTKYPVAEPLRGAPPCFPDPSSSLPPHLLRQAELIPSW